MDGQKSDIYSLALSLIEIRRPEISFKTEYQNYDFDTFGQKILLGNAHYHYFSNHPDPMVRAISQGLHPNPNMRPTAAEMRDILNSIP
jgi:hypothetical protein